MVERQVPKIEYFDSLDSTNQKLKEMLQDPSLPEFTVVYADYQTAGRGQPGNTWESEKGKNLTFSILIKPDFIDVGEQFTITQLVTLAILDVLRPHCKTVSVKWPNDIYAGDQKLAGILIENSLKGSYIYNSVIGIGLNLNQKTFSAKLPNAVSLSKLTGKEHDVKKTLKLFIKAFANRYIAFAENPDFRKLSADYVEHLYRNKGSHLYKDQNGSFEAEFHEIKPTGQLVLKRSDGSLNSYSFKEVEFII